MYNTVLITPGAAGTFMMADLIGIKNLNNNIQGFNRHQKNPDIKNCTHVVYLYSNPYDTILSYYRRGFMSNIIHCMNMGGDVEFFQKNKTNNLIEFLKLDKEPFEIEKHFLNYYHFNDRKYKIMFVKYEYLTNHIEKVLEWFNSKEKIKDFSFTERNSKWQNQDDEVKKLLKQKIGSHKDFIDSLPSMFIL